MKVTNRVRVILLMMVQVWMISLSEVLNRTRSHPDGCDLLMSFEN